MAPNPRIDELRKRLDKEPASRLFAQLAEELRKEGDLEAAIAVCRDGLEKHPNYPSARMTLGRALLDTGDFAAARSEFDAVMKAAPDNILASRYLAECHEKLGDLDRAEAQYRHTLRLSPDDKQVAARLEAIAQRRGGSPAATPPPAATRPGAATPPAPPSGSGTEPAASPARSVAPTPGAVSSPSLPRATPSSPALPPSPPAAPRPSLAAVAPTPPPPVAVAAAPPAEPPPIPLVETDEEFELERAYEAPRAVATRKTTAQEALEREFEAESARKAADAARWPPVAPVDDGDAIEAMTETTLPGASAPSLEDLEGSTGTTARFTALDEEAIEQAARERERESAAAARFDTDPIPVVVPEPHPEPEIVTDIPPVVAPGYGSGAQRPGLETLFRFSAFDVESAVVAQGRGPVAPVEPAPAPTFVAPLPPAIVAPPAPPPAFVAPPPPAPAPPAPAPPPVAVPPAAVPPPPPPAVVAPPSVVVGDAGEIVSPTIAELYFGQGHIDKAIDVYRRLLRGGPENEKARRRLLELEALDRRTREEAPVGVAGASRAERRAVLERTISRLEALLTVIRKE